MRPAGSYLFHWNINNQSRTKNSFPATNTMRKSLPVEKINKLPKSPGVYFLKDRNGKIFYIGKANNLRLRLQSHARDGKILEAKNYKLKTVRVEWIKTANEIESLIKEAQYIKHYMPRLNVRLRDDKKYSYAGITREDCPRIFLTHQPVAGALVQNSKFKVDYLGPYTDAKALRVVMRYLRKIFPYYLTTDKKIKNGHPHPKLMCAYCHLRLCPGPAPDKRAYRKDINAIRQLLEGKKNTLLKKLKREMVNAVKKQEYEKAQKLRGIIETVKKIFAHHAGPTAPTLETRDISRKIYSAGDYLAGLLKTDLPIVSIEGYDISNIQGKEPTASMVRFDRGYPNKALYRKFNIQAPDKPNDYLMMREVIRRRFNHAEWSYPDLILIDGGRWQFNSARLELRKLGLDIPTVSLAKREEKLYLPTKPNPILLSTMPNEVGNLLKYVRDEAHRFAITHHRSRHRKTFI